VTESTADGAVLVLGIGNVLLRDEGAGVRALERLEAKYELPERVQTLDGGTMGLDLLPYIEQASSLLILDAVRTGRLPGSLVRLEGDEIPSVLALKLSVHQVGFQELLAASLFRGTLPSRIVLFGIEPASVDWGLELSEEVADALDSMAAAAVQELQGWGMTVRPVKRQVRSQGLCSV
jgi:hydrogenase maturation protease